MWIMTQTKNALINTDNIVSIFIERQKGYIKARIAKTDDNKEPVVILGSYDTEKIDGVFKYIFKMLDTRERFGFLVIEMPLGGEVEKNERGV